MSADFSKKLKHNISQDSIQRLQSCSKQTGIAGMNDESLNRFTQLFEKRPKFGS
jgi:hypothetical protein